MSVHNANIKLGLLVLVALVMMGCGEKATVQEAEEKVVIRPAKLMKVGESSGQKMLTFPAVIQAKQSSELAFQVGGVIIDMAVTEGLAVEKGQLLAQLDSRDYVAKLDVAKAQYEIADAEYTRALALIDSNVISKSEVAKRKADYEVAKSQLASAQKALDDTTLRAPFAGRIARVLFREDESTKSGDEAFILLSLDHLEAKIDMPSSEIVYGRERKNTEISAYVLLDAAPEYRIKAMFKEVALEADRESQTYEVIFGFDSIEELTILPGMSATVYINEFEPESAPRVTVPLSAIGSDADINFVWVVDVETMQVAKRIVVLESGIGEEFKVLSGLELGETIVVAGISTLIEGAVVRPWVK